MIYKCDSCGNTHRFRAKQNRIEYVTEDVLIDNSGHIVEYLDADTYDSESDGDIENIECDVCESEDVRMVDEEELKEDNSLKTIIEGLTEVEQ